MDDFPSQQVTWYDATAYCNWLSDKEGIPQDQWCYEPNQNGKFAAGMKPRNDCLKLIGYRLPTSSEWEFACRAGAHASRYYGNSDELLSHYACYRGNAGLTMLKDVDRVGMRKPNDFGLFDMLGNVQERCHNRQLSGDQLIPDLRSYPVGNELPDFEPVIDNQVRFVRGGHFESLAGKLGASNYFSAQANLRNIETGFRIVRTLP